MREKRNAYRKAEKKRPVGRSIRKRVGNIKMDISEIGWGGMDWIVLAKDREQCRFLVNTIMNLWVLEYL
jgi:hypothetical protein